MAKKSKKSVLAQLREQAGFATVLEASGPVGYHPVYLRDLETGRARVTGNALVRLAKAYRMTVEDLESRLNTRRNGANAA